MNKRSLGHLRLASQRIVGQMQRNVADVARHMLAIQGQDFPGAKWSLALRSPGTTDADIEAALAARSVVRSWPLRGTLHICAAEDLGWILKLTAERVVKGAAGRRRELSLDDKTLARARTVAEKKLAGGAILSRDALLQAFASAKISVEGQRGYHLLWHLSLTGILCFGPPQGKAQTFVLLADWVETPRTLEHDEALEELARRYFTSHGPATINDLAWWAKLTLADAKKAVALASAGKALVDLRADDVTYWMSAHADGGLRDAGALSRDVALLPGFDEYLLGYQDRSAVLAKEHGERIVPGGNGMFLPTIVLDGQVVGTWRRIVRAKQVDIEPVPFAKWTKSAAKSFEHAAEHYAAYLGRGANIVQPRTTGP